MNQYLIPANSKRSMLILSLFSPVDLIIFCIGAGMTLIMMMFIKTETTIDLMVIVAPLLISGIMVAPVPNHRNIWQLTANVYNYLSHRRTYYWKGWRALDEEANGE